MHLLVDYSSGSDEESESPSLPDTSAPGSVSGDGARTTITSRLPLANLLKENIKKESVKDNPAEYEGRVRSFPHERGNWSSHVFIPYGDGGELEALVDAIIEHCCDCGTEIRPIVETHVSLTRTFVLLYHWINEFVSTVRTAMSSLSPFSLRLGGIKAYVNDECSRSFLGLTVVTGQEHLSEVVSQLDSCLSQYRLKPFYEESSFHISVCWCLGDKRQYFQSVLPRLEEIVGEFFSEHSSCSTINVSQLTAKIGNRIYNFDFNS